jgi:hypothetical protein
MIAVYSSVFSARDARSPSSAEGVYADGCRIARSSRDFERLRRMSPPSFCFAENADH